MKKVDDTYKKHNALFDAEIIKLCYDKLYDNYSDYMWEYHHG